LMSLSEAIAKIPDGCGLQVHRSWWVARTAVTGTRRSGRSTSLMIGDVLSVPVSRANVPHVREAGWMDL
ncbi:MAG: LytTR family DNA-binding domain-containing protein, partial [Pontixanthobacter sp.]